MELKQTLNASVSGRSISSAEQFIILGLPWPSGSLALAVVRLRERVAVKGGSALWMFFRDVLIHSQGNPVIEKKGRERHWNPWLRYLLLVSRWQIIPRFERLL